MKNARLIACAALALAVPAVAGASGPCDKNHYILDEPCARWVPVSDDLADLDVQVVAVDPVNATTLYAGGAIGVIKSFDGGAHWWTTGLDLVSRDRQDTFAAILRFSNIPTNLSSVVAHLAIDPQRAGTLYAATKWTTGAWYGQRRVFKSADGGETWTDDASPAINGSDNIMSLAMAPSDPSVLYVANFDGMGDSWSPMVRSDDRASTWNYLSYLVLNVLAVDPVDAHTVYGGTFDFPPYFTDLPNGIVKSRDGGETWLPTGLVGDGVTALSVAAGDRRALYAATGSTARWSARYAGLFKSTDAGETWTALDNPLMDAASPVVTIVVDAADKNRVYVATNRGVSRSVDAGASWTALDSGLEGLTVHSIVMVRGDPNILYAATSGGVFRTED